MQRLKSSLADLIKDQSAFIAVFFVFAYLTSYHISGTQYPVQGLDQSWQAVLETAFQLKFQFGRDIVFSYGPLGYLYADFSQGRMIGLRILFALFWALMIALTATSLVRQTKGWMRILFISWFLIFFHYGFVKTLSFEGQALLIVAYGSLLFMSDIGERKTISVLIIVAFALLSLIKFTFFLSVVIGLILSSLGQIAEKRYHAAWIIPVSFSAVFSLFWLTAGQEPASLWPWLIGSLSIVGGYTEAMTSPPNPWVLGFCVSAAILFIVALIIIIRRSQMTLNRATSLGVILLVTFLSWKHSFTRLHIFSFTSFLPIAFTLATIEHDKIDLSVVARNMITTLYGGVILLTVIAGNIQANGYVASTIIKFPKLLLDNSKLLVKSVSGDWQDCYADVRRGAAEPRNPDLPIARSVIGGDTVDVINYGQWAALANNLNYHPRPVFQGYSAYTPFLQDLNLSFYQSERHPRFLLFNLETIDDRYPMMDDATLLPFIFKNYKVVAQDGVFLVLREKGGPAVDVNMRLVHEQSLAFDEILDLRKWNNGLLIIQTVVRPSLFGRLYAFLYQAPVLFMNIYVGEGILSTRFISAMAEQGFMINPFLWENPDVVNFYQKTGIPVKGISLSKGETSDLLVSKKITVKIFSVI